MAYAGTLQAEALGLVAAKTRASLMIEGELPEEGVAALDGDGSDVYLALARRLAEPGAGAAAHAQSLEALFAEARRVEDAADEVLVAGRWDDKLETTQEPIAFPARPLPLSAESVNGLPLFATNRPMSLPAGVLPTGRLVTLEELAQLLRPRKRRPKPVPEGQLALLDD